MNQKLKEKILEAFSSVVPITLIVLVLSVLLVPMEVGTVLMFLTGAVFLIVGMGFFSLGADTAMIPIGEGMGVTVSRTKKLWLLMGIGLAMGIIITIAEPDLQVLANQVPSIPDQTLIWTVALGVGIFLVIAILRIFFKHNLALMLMISYGIIFSSPSGFPTTFCPSRLTRAG